MITVTLSVTQRGGTYMRDATTLPPRYVPVRFAPHTHASPTRTAERASLLLRAPGAAR